MNIMFDVQKRDVLFRRRNIYAGYVTGPVSETFDSLRQIFFRKLCGRYYVFPICSEKIIVLLSHKQVSIDNPLEVTGLDFIQSVTGLQSEVSEYRVKVLQLLKRFRLLFYDLYHTLLFNQLFYLQSEILYFKRILGIIHHTISALNVSLISLSFDARSERELVRLTCWCSWLLCRWKRIVWIHRVWCSGHSRLLCCLCCL